MFSPEHLTAAALQKQAKTLGGCNQDILERSLYALTLLGHLADTGLPFVFKGGTSLLLHLPTVRRLSIDIDIVCGEKPAVINEVVARISKLPPFFRSEEHVREHFIKLPHRRHFKFYYRSAIGKQPEVPILLDVVEESRIHHQIVERPIQTSFIKPEREIKVKLPTVESLLGDKLTAFAPTTVGVALRNAEGQPGEDTAARLSNAARVSSYEMPLGKRMTGAAFQIPFKILGEIQSFKSSVKFYFPRFELFGVRAFSRVMLGQALLQI